MSTTRQATVTISLTELEDVIQRVVQETMREELKRFLRSPNRAILDYWAHEGPDDPNGDQELLHEAVSIIREYEQSTEGWKTLEEFEAELEAETAHEIPR